MLEIQQLRQQFPALRGQGGRPPVFLDGPGGMHAGLLIAIAGVAYFVVWTAIGCFVYPLGAALATIEMRQPALARAVPIASGVVVLMAGMIQFSAGKVRYLAGCRQTLGRGLGLPATAGTAWRQGLRLGLHCCCNCAGLTAILLVLGVMDVRVMAVVATAITIERLAAGGTHVPRIIGAVAVGTGVLLILRAAAVR
jgi:predicted metal-binding membrane protein